MIIFRNGDLVIDTGETTVAIHWVVLAVAAMILAALVAGIFAIISAIRSTRRDD